MIEITLLGEPKSTQTIYKVTCRGNFGSLYMSKDGKDIKEHYTLQARSQVKIKPYIGFLTVKMRIFMGTKRKSDIDNFNKLCFDSLTGIAWEDDSQIVELNIVKGYCKENPRIELDIYELPMC